MWHKHPEQQQRGIQFEPLITPAGKREGPASPALANRTVRDVTGAIQQGFAKPRPMPAQPAAR